MSDKAESNHADTELDGTRPKADSPSRSIRGTRRSARLASARFRGLAGALKAAAVASIITVGMIGASHPAQAASIHGDPAYLNCETGTISAKLPIVFDATTSGIIWQITAVQRWNGSAGTWEFVSWSYWRYASLGAGQSNQGWWTDLNGNGSRSEQINVAPGSYYALAQWVWADGAWIYRYPLVGGDLGTLPYCFA